MRRRTSHGRQALRRQLFDLEKADQTVCGGIGEAGRGATRRNRPGERDEQDDLPLNLERAQIELVKRVLAQANGNVSKAAELLGINRTKVYRILSGEVGDA